MEASTCNEDGWILNSSPDVSLGNPPSFLEEGLTSCYNGGTYSDGCQNTGSPIGATCDHTMNGNRASELLIWVDSTATAISVVITQPFATVCYYLVTVTVPPLECDAGYSGVSCATADACAATTDSSNDGSDGSFYCINGGTIGGTTTACTCTSCDAGYSGSSCATADACVATTDSNDDGSDGNFHCVSTGTIGGTTTACTCGCDAGYIGAGCATVACITSNSENTDCVALADSNIQTAVSAWIADAGTAEATYGHIRDW